MADSFPVYADNPGLRKASAKEAIPDDVYYVYSVDWIVVVYGGVDDHYHR